MSKRKSQTKQPPTTKRPSSSAKGSQPTGLTVRFSRKWLIGAVVVVIVLVVGAVFLIQSQTKSQNLSSAYVVGGVQECTGLSPFMTAKGFGVRSALDTRVKFVKGIALREFDQKGNIVRSYQDPSWSSAGYLGTFQRDLKGNIYVIPVPAISILDNPPEKANIIYRIDGETGIMAPFVNLPALAPSNSQNAYGLLSITYDCYTNSLYASSVAGSSYNQVAGTIFQIDAETGTIRSRLEYVDAFGLGIFNMVSGKRLYFGMARTPDLYSVALDENGIISKDVRPEPTFSIAGVTSDERVQSINFQDPNELIIKTTPFDFNLVAPTEIQQSLLTYNYNYKQDQWIYVNSQVIAS